MIESISPKGREGSFVIFVDGMDGDVCRDWVDMTCAVTYAFQKDATEVVIKRWPEQILR